MEKTGGLSSDLAHALPGMRVILVERIPLKDTLNEALGAYLSAHAKEKKDIWAAREVTLEPGKNYQPVNVAVWDSGVDLAIFRDRVVKELRGQPAVLAYDIESRKTTGNLYPLNAAQAGTLSGSQEGTERAFRPASQHGEPRIHRGEAGPGQAQAGTGETLH